MKVHRNHLLSGILGFVIALGIVLRIPVLGSMALVNLAMIQILAVPLSDPSWYVSVHGPQTGWYPPQKLATNEAVLERQLALLQRAASIDPAADRSYLHIAEVLFALGKRREAAAILSQNGWGVECPSHAQRQDYPLGTPVPTNVLTRASPLSVQGQYEYHLIQAYQHMMAECWDPAVWHFRQALAYVGERALLQDRRDFFWASARWHLEQGRDHPIERLLAGKYFTLSGEWVQAVTILQPLLDVGAGLSSIQRAWAALYLGRAYQEQGDVILAKNAYQLGWQIAPAVRENGIRLLALLRTFGQEDQADQIKEQLRALGPAYPSGRYAPGYRMAYNSVLPSGLSFAGYDLDPESVEHGAPLEVWLWWQKTSDEQLVSREEGDRIDLGSYLLQHQWVTNLVVNNAFEWGEKPDGVPLGWERRIYSEAPESLYITTTIRDGRRTKVVVGSNLKNDSSGLFGFELPMQTDGWYLMAGWMNDAGAGNIGRNCVGPEFWPGGPYYIAYPKQTPRRPDGVWVHIADLAPAFPAQKPDRCRMILVNYQSPGGITMWDDLILARITPPWLLGD